VLKLEPPPVELIVTWPKPLVGDNVIFGPASNWVTPPLEAYDALIACEALVANDAVPNKLPVNDPLNDPVLYELVKLLNDDVVTKLDVAVLMLWVNALNELVVTKALVSIVVPAFNAYDAVVAYELLIATDELYAHDDVPSNEPVNEPVKDPVLYELVKVLNELVKVLNDDVVTNEPVSIVVPTFRAYDAVVANELLIATDALSAQLAVPCNEPINDPLNDPVLYELVKVLYDDVNVLNELVVINDDVWLFVTNELVAVLILWVNALNEDVVTNEPVSIVVPAFSAYDAVKANDDVPANCDVLEPV